MGNFFRFCIKLPISGVVRRLNGQYSFIKKSLHWLAVSKRGFVLNFYRENPLIQIQ